MALQKQTLNISFAQGVDTKTDPWQVPIGKMLARSNSVFDTAGLLQKRNGNGALSSLSNTSSTTLATFKGNLLAVGNQLQVLSQNTGLWSNRGVIQPLSLSTVPLVRTGSSQTTVDVAVASNNLSCVVWLDADTSCYYQIADSQTGQIIVLQTALPATSTMPRVFALGSYFVITFLATVSATSHLRYIAIPIATPASPGSATDLSTQAKSLTAGYDGYVANNNLYVAVDGSDGGGAIRITYLDSTLAQHSTKTIAGKTSNLMSVTADTSNSTAVIWITFWNSGNSNGYTVAYNQSLTSILTSTLTINNIAINRLTSSANAGVVTLFYEVANTYSYSPNAVSNYVSTVTCTQAGSVGTPAVALRSVGLASKAFYFSANVTSYVLVTYGGAFQPTYFLMDQSGNVVAKLAYSNGGGYAINQILPNVNLDENTVQIGYLFKDLLASVNKSQGVSATAGIYSQLGVNLATFEFNSNVITSEIGNNLHLSGGFLWMYDGVKPVEHSFHLWPEDLVATSVTTTGHLAAQIYYYYATYEWTDAQGNIHRSAPSVPLAVDLSGAGTSTNKVTLNIPYLRLTYKLSPNPARIVVYRWSTAQQIPYQVTSITSPQTNSVTSDSLAYVDTLADSSILGNLILYTNGGVVENIAAPACSTAILSKSRLFVVYAEDLNLLGYSKQVIENTPVEMSDLFTLYVAPTTGVQGGTGPTRCMGAMDDKTIAFKADAIYYFTGSGPDNTGANNDFSDPVFITSTVGCSNQQSIVLIPQGLMFQSDKGIWLLGRDLSTSYIGDAVEVYNSNTVLSAVSVPGTNQVRFTLDNGISLMYDYFYNQWDTPSISAVSSTIYQSLQTSLNSSGQVFQETPGLYLDVANPVLMSFTTAWVQLAGIQGYQRAYFFYLLGEFITPHKLSIQIAYDYNDFPSQSAIIMPINSNSLYGSDPLYGSSSPYGSSGAVEQWRVFFEKQKCQAFRLSVAEIYDPSYGIAAGAGLTLSSIKCVIGTKSQYPRVSSINATS